MSKKGKRKEVKKKKRNLGRCSFKGIPQWEVGLRSRESAHRNSGQWNYAVFSPALSFSSSDQPRETDSPFPRRRIYQWKTTFPVDTATKSTLFAKRSTKLDAKLRYETRFDRKSTLVRVICHHYTDLDASDQRFLFFSNPCLLFKRISDIYIYIQISNQSLYFLRKKFFQQRPFLRWEYISRISFLVDRFRKKISIGSLYRAGGRRMGG